MLSNEPINISGHPNGVTTQVLAGTLFFVHLTVPGC